MGREKEENQQKDYIDGKQYKERYGIDGVKEEYVKDWNKWTTGTLQWSCTGPPTFIINKQTKWAWCVEDIKMPVTEH